MRKSSVSNAATSPSSSKKKPKKKKGGGAAGIDLSNLAACIAESRDAALENDAGMPVPLDFHELRVRLEKAKASLSPLYRKVAAEPFLAALDSLGASGLQEILDQDPRRERLAGLLLDIAAAILQPAESPDRRPVAAFHELVSDLYDGFLSAEDRRGVLPPDLEVFPPLVKFGNPEIGPYTWPSDSTRNFGVEIAVVSLPPSNARRDLFAWTTIGHETAGHDVLHADVGLMGQVGDAVRRSLLANSSTAPLASYWSEKIDETASDVLGILNMGPAAAIGLIAYFRALNAAFGNGPHLGNDDPGGDPHPADVLRGWLGAEVVRGLQFAQASEWADRLVAETDHDAKASITLGDLQVSKAVARASAGAVARAIATTPMAALENHAFGEIQTWRDADEAIVAQLRAALAAEGPVPPDVLTGAYAAHVVAAAATGALARDGAPVRLFPRMVELLKRMNEANPAFGPLLVRHPGNVVRDRVWRKGWPAAAARRPASRESRAPTFDREAAVSET